MERLKIINEVNGELQLEVAQRFLDKTITPEEFKLEMLKIQKEVAEKVNEMVKYFLDKRRLEVVHKQYELTHAERQWSPDEDYEKLINEKKTQA